MILVSGTLAHVTAEDRSFVSVILGGFGGTSGPAMEVEGEQVAIDADGVASALTDSDRNGIADSKELVAENLTFATGVSLYEGDLYFSEIDKIWIINNIFIRGVKAFFTMSRAQCV